MTYRAALVTGATSGIGAAFARALPASTDLLLTGRRTDRLEALRAELASAGTGAGTAKPARRIELLTADLAAPGGPEHVAAVAEAFKIDLLINNAGLGRFGAVADNPLATERAMVETNVVAPLVLTRTLLPGMQQRAEATGSRAGIILVASVVGFAGLPFMATYAATKAFDLRFAEGLAAELAGTSVDVLALCPGTTETEFSEHAGMRQRTGGHKPEQVARAGLRALGHETVHVVGMANRATTMAFKLLPRGVIGWAARLALRPR